MSNLLVPTCGRYGCSLIIWWVINSVPCWHFYFVLFIAKMTRCGHIYCWSCILHYLSLVGSTLSLYWCRSYVTFMVFDGLISPLSHSRFPFVLFQQTDKQWHKCPICYEAVHKKALKRYTNVTSELALVTNILVTSRVEFPKERLATDVQTLESSCRK